MTEGKNSLIKAATNEYTLLLYRGITALCAVVVTLFVIGTRSDVKSIADDLGAFKVAYAERIARVEGRVDELKGSVEAHRRRLDGNDNDIRSIWVKIYELATRNSVPPRGNP